tara:strand:- start:103 stop:333 length:231 start_codon:yes stop_codon:yes gene_type:complete
MSINIKYPSDINLNYVTVQKMAFLFNALEEGWQIKKHRNKYIFSKKHEGKKEVYLDDYIRRFIERNFDINNIINQT